MVFMLAVNSWIVGVGFESAANAVSEEIRTEEISRIAQNRGIRHLQENGAEFIVLRFQSQVR
jgi:hypothetical protein